MAAEPFDSLGMRPISHGNIAFFFLLTTRRPWHGRPQHSGRLRKGLGELPQQPCSITGMAGASICWM
jgi:hypothetical protein